VGEISMGLSILEIILCVFFMALAITLICRKLRLSVILGYLVVGALVGPHALNWAHNSEYTRDLAEFGIVFLMFTVGLEFSLPKLFSLKFPVFVMGGFQVLLTILITFFAGKCFGMTTLSALVLGSIAAMSSTAIVIKQLNDQMELHTQHGLNAVGILLFQDLAVIPLIILIASLSDGSQEHLSTILLWALGKGVLAILLIFLTGRWLLRPLFRIIAKTRAIELFTLTVLLVTLTAAWLTNFLGLSYALGAFLAGLMLAETEFRHQIEIEIRPFRDILLGLFFITIGMLTDISHWDDTWEWILLLVVGLVIGKSILITLICRLTGNKLSESFRTGLVLAQGGEFVFALLTLELNNHILPPDYDQVILAALLISIALAPIITRYNQTIAAFFLPKEIKYDMEESKNKISMMVKPLKKHVIICGYGRVGQHIARLLDKIHIPYVGLDLDAELVHFASLAGDKVLYGDPSHPGILQAAGLDTAKVLVISFDDLKTATKVLGIVKHVRPQLPILVRCRDEFELKQLKNVGAKYIIAELFEASLTISHQLLTLLNIPSTQIHDLIQEGRSKDYDMLQRIFTGHYEDKPFDYGLEEQKQLRPILISKESYASGKTIKKLKLNIPKIELMAIRRGESKFLKPKPDTILEENDILIVYGPLAALEKIERYLMDGMAEF
jgi:CPA2 family monovalent cation:H+ antiporter-2